MKKSFLLLGMLTCAICLTACGSKNYEMSFDEALEIANHSDLQDILVKNDNFEETLTIAGSYDVEWTKIDANISSVGKESLLNKTSESSTNFWADISLEWDSIKLDWAFDIKLVDDAIYLNLSSLDLTWSEDLAMLAMMTEWFKNQWFVIPMTGLSDMPNTFSMLKDSKNLDEKTKEIIINEWSTVYNWKFTEFNWYNAWKFSLNNEKIQELINNYYSKINETLDEDINQEIPQLDIQNFEWYLVIVWKDKVTTVIENMDIADWDTILNVIGFFGENYDMTISSDWEPVLTFTANKKNSNYEIALNMNDYIKLEWTIYPKLSSSKIDIKFDLALNIKSDSEEVEDMVIPMKGNWTYNSISEFTVEIPEDAQDLTEILQSYLWGMMGWDEFEDFEDYDYSDYDDYEDFGEAEENIPEEVLDNSIDGE